MPPGMPPVVRFIVIFCLQHWGFFILFMGEMQGKIISLFRSQKLEKLYFSAGVEVAYAATGDERIKEKALANAIPEFIRFNIVENEVRNIC